MNRVSAGRAGHNWRKLVANLKAAGHDCAECGMPIDYRLRWPDPNSFSVDHRLPLSTHPHLAEDPSNLRPTHLRCNLSKGNRETKPSLGTTSRNW